MLPWLSVSNYVNDINYFSESTRPLTNHFCITTTTSPGGSMARIMVAITRFHSTAESPPEISVLARCRRPRCPMHR